MKIYTRTGDDGTTGLIGGQRVAKSDARMDCIGGVDETNAAIGVAVASVDGSRGADAGNPDAAALRERLLRVQHELFVIGSHLAAADERWAASLPPMDEQLVDRLEREIDAADARLPPLQNFILPGGSVASAHLHLARTVCRRAERQLVAFAQTDAVEPAVLTYMNRLSDWMFVQARLANHLAGVEDVPWRK